MGLIRLPWTPLWLAALAAVFPTLTYADTQQIERFFPLARGTWHADDRRVVAGIVCDIRHDLQWKGAAMGECPHNTLYIGFARWSGSPHLSTKDW